MQGDGDAVKASWQSYVRPFMRVFMLYYACYKQPATARFAIHTRTDSQVLKGSLFSTYVTCSVSSAGTHINKIALLCVTMLFLPGLFFHQLQSDAQNMTSLIYTVYTPKLLDEA